MLKKFYLAWLALGLMQVVCWSGCSGQEESLAGSSVLQSGDPRLEQDSQTPLAIPIRLSLGFFANGNLSAELRFSPPSQKISSHVEWKDFPASEPAPTSSAQADFRDHPSCAILTDALGAMLCFNVQGDVSSVTANADQMKLEGIETLIAHNYPCADGQVREVSFVSAKKDSNSFTTSFVAKRAGGCGAIAFELQISQI